jgi:hypothetical protein
VDSYFDDLEEKEVNTIELITKIPHKVFIQQQVVIELDGLDLIKADWYGGLSQPGLYRHKYKLSK